MYTELVLNNITKYKILNYMVVQQITGFVLLNTYNIYIYIHMYFMKVVHSRVATIGHACIPGQFTM